MDNTNDIKNPELILAMAALRANSTDDNMLKVLTAAVSAKFVLPVEGDIKDKMRFHAVTGSDGNIYQVVYADSVSFAQAFGANSQNGLVANFMDLADLVAGPKSKVNGFVLNPGKEEIIFKKEMIQAVVTQLVAEGIVPADRAGAANNGKDNSGAAKSTTSNVKVGDAERLPEGLGNATIELGNEFEEIFKITIQLMQYEGEDKPKWLFIVDHNGDSEEIFGYLGKKVGPYLAGLDIVMVDADSDFGKSAAAGKIPVYAK